MPRICFVQPSLNAVYETFLRAHGDQRPGVAAIVHLSEAIPWIGEEPVLLQAWETRATHKIGRLMRRRDWNWEVDAGFVAAIRRSAAQVVLAEYGGTGVAVLNACRREEVPLIVQFHGYNASRHEVIERPREVYRRLFQQASAMIGVSRAMERQLLLLDAGGRSSFTAFVGPNATSFGAPTLAKPTTLLSWWAVSWKTKWHHT